jgi:hypothetical protein
MVCECVCVGALGGESLFFVLCMCRVKENAYHLRLLTRLRRIRLRLHRRIAHSAHGVQIASDIPLDNPPNQHPIEGAYLPRDGG